jgi:hypothetical protein
MAVRDDFTAGEVLAAADLNDTFASKPPFAYGTATPSTTVEGFIWYDENDTPPAPKFWDGSAFQALGGGKVLQVVRATDTTFRTTTSLTYVDVTGMSVTISPQKSTSSIMLIVSAMASVAGNVAEQAGDFQITDASNNSLTGSRLTIASNDYTKAATSSMNVPLSLIGWDTPATTSAVTYKLRFLARVSGGSCSVFNQLTTGQMFAIEVSA